MSDLTEDKKQRKNNVESIESINRNKREYWKDMQKKRNC